MIPNPTNAWPLLNPTEDEWAGDEWLYDAPDYQLYREQYAALSRAEWEQLDRRFMDLFFQALRGERPYDDTELLALADQLSLVHERTHDRRVVSPAMAVGNDLVCDVAEDYAPDISLLALDRFLGPWADQRLSRRVRAAAAAAAVWIPLLDGPASPAQRFYTAKPRPPKEERAAIRAAGYAPAMLFEADTWRPLLPLGAPWVPSGPVNGEIAPLATPVRAVLARVYRCTDGSWQAIGAIGLPHVPPLDKLEARLELELLRVRRHDRRANWETMLRQRSEVLYRSCATWNWLALEES